MDGAGAAGSDAGRPTESLMCGWAAVLESRPSPLRPTAAHGRAPAALATALSVEAAGMPPAVNMERGRREPAHQPQPASRRQPGYSSLISWQTLRLDVRKGAPLRRVTLAEVQQHCSPEDAWIILRGRVYSITEYSSYHPGGVEVLCAAAGTDCTKLFDRHHRWVNGEGLLKKWCERLLSSAVKCKRSHVLHNPYNQFLFCIRDANVHCVLFAVCVR